MKPLPSTHKLLDWQVSSLSLKQLIAVIVLVFIVLNVVWSGYLYLTDTRSKRSTGYEAKRTECHENPYVVLKPDNWSLLPDNSKKAVAPTDAKYQDALNKALIPHHRYAFLCRNETAPPPTF
jgi:hypothetical protein